MTAAVESPMLYQGQDFGSSFDAQGGMEQNGMEQSNGFANGKAKENNASQSEQKDFHFLRLPRPDTSADDIEIAKIKADHQNVKMEEEMMKQKLTLLFVDHNERQASTREAREVLNQITAQANELKTKLEPLKNASKSQGSRVSDHNRQGRQLECRSEAELDERIKALDDKIQFGALPLAEERAVMKDIQKLKASRPQVLEYQAVHQAVQVDKEELSILREHQDELQNELKMIRTQQSQAWMVLQEHDKEEKAIKEQINELKAEKSKARTKNEECWAALNQARDRRTEKMNKWGANRSFGRELRGQIANCDVESARSKAMEQINEVIELLYNNKEAAKEYFAQCDLNRKHPYTEADVISDAMKKGKDKPAKKAQAKAQVASRSVPAITPAVSSPTPAPKFSPPVPKPRQSTRSIAVDEQQEAIEIVVPRVSKHDAKELSVEEQKSINVQKFEDARARQQQYKSNKEKKRAKMEKKKAEEAQLAAQKAQIVEREVAAQASRKAAKEKAVKNVDGDTGGEGNVGEVAQRSIPQGVLSKGERAKKQPTQVRKKVIASKEKEQTKVSFKRAKQLYNENPVLVGAAGVITVMCVIVGLAVTTNSLGL